MDIESQLKEATKQIKHLNRELKQFQEDNVRLTTLVKEQENAMVAANNMHRPITEEERNTHMELIKKLSTAANIPNPIELENCPLVSVTDTVVLEEVTACDKAALFDMMKILITKVDEVSKQIKIHEMSIHSDNNNNYNNHFFRDEKFSEDHPEIRHFASEQCNKSDISGKHSPQASIKYRSQLAIIQNQHTFTESAASTTNHPNNTLSYSSSIQAAASTDLSDEEFRVLKQGIVVLRHGRMSSKKERKLFLSQDLLLICWQHNDDVRKSPSGRNLNEFLRSAI